MINKKKILILIFLFVAVAGFTLNPASATSKTIKITDSYYGIEKSIGNGDKITTVYISGYSGQSGKTRYLQISLWNYKTYPNGKYYKMNKAKVYYQKSNGRTVFQTYKPDRYGYIGKIVPKGYTPKKAIVYYNRK